jgi:hypothetical protein
MLSKEENHDYSLGFPLQIYLIEQELTIFNIGDCLETVWRDIAYKKLVFVD